MTDDELLRYLDNNFNKAGVTCTACGCNCNRGWIKVSRHLRKEQNNIIFEWLAIHPSIKGIELKNGDNMSVTKSN